MAGAEVVAEIGVVAGAGAETEDGAGVEFGAVAGTGAETVGVSVAGAEAGEGAGAASGAGAERWTGSGAECENVGGHGDGVGFEAGKGPSCSQSPMGPVM